MPILTRALVAPTDLGKLDGRPGSLMPAPTSAWKNSRRHLASRHRPRGEYEGNTPSFSLGPSPPNCAFFFSRQRSCIALKSCRCARSLLRWLSDSFRIHLCE